MTIRETEQQLPKQEVKKTKMNWTTESQKGSEHENHHQFVSMNKQHKRGRISPKHQHTDENECESEIYLIFCHQVTELLFG